MIAQLLLKMGRWLADHQDPRYRNAPFVLPTVWRGSGAALTDAELARLNINVRDIGLDPVAVSRQPHNQALLRMTRARSIPSKKTDR